MKSPTEIPGLAVWVEDKTENPVIFPPEGDSFWWANPNDANQGTFLVFNRRLSSEERAQVEAWLFARYNPAPDFGR